MFFSLPSQYPPTYKPQILHLFHQVILIYILSMKIFTSLPLTLLPLTPWPKTLFKSFPLYTIYKKKLFFEPPLTPFPHHRIHQHKAYNPSTLANDIAIIELPSRLELEDPRVGPVCLPRPGLLYEDAAAFVTGWGRVSEGGLGIPHFTLSLSCRTMLPSHQIINRFNKHVFKWRPVFIRSNKQTANKIQGYFKCYIIYVQRPIFRYLSFS